MSKGYVYVLTNPAMPGLVKIGRTTGDPEVRAAQLRSTGVPMPFEVKCSVLSPDCIELEEEMHDFFAEYRVCGSREFFNLEISRVEAQLENELRAQVECFVDEFMPDNIVVRPELTIDPAHLELMAYQLEEPIPVVAQSIYRIEADELRPFVLRYYDKISEAKKVNLQ